MLETPEITQTTAHRADLRPSYDGLFAAWKEFNAWVKAEGLKTAPTLWEVYLSGPETTSDASQWRTQLNQPLAE